MDKYKQIVSKTVWRNIFTFIFVLCDILQGRLIAEQLVKILVKTVTSCVTTREIYHQTLLFFNLITEHDN